MKIMTTKLGFVVEDHRGRPTKVAKAKRELAAFDRERRSRSREAYAEARRLKASAAHASALDDTAERVASVSDS